MTHDLFCAMAEWPSGDQCSCKRIEKVRKHERMIADKAWNQISVFTEKVMYDQGYTSGLGEAIRLLKGSVDTMAIARRDGMWSDGDDAYLEALVDCIAIMEDMIEVKQRGIDNVF